MPTLQSFMTRAKGARIDNRQGYVVIKQNVDGFDRDDLILPPGFQLLASLAERNIDIIGSEEDRVLFIRMDSKASVLMAEDDDTYKALLGATIARMYLLKHGQL